MEEDSKLVNSLLKGWERRDKQVQSKRDDRSALGSRSGLRRTGVLRIQRERRTQKAKNTNDVQNVMAPKSIVDQFVLPPVINDNLCSSVDQQLAEAINNVERAMEDINQDNAMQQPVASDPYPRKNWSQRKKNNYEDWEEDGCDLMRAFVASHCFTESNCEECHCQMRKFCIDCKTCRRLLCFDCDQTIHVPMPFHSRVLSNATTSRILLPMEFVRSSGRVHSLDVPVPCKTAKSCDSCGKLGTCRLKAEKRVLALITKKGRFDLCNAMFECQDCGFIRPASTLEYIGNRWWPGLPKNSKYFFCMDLFDMLHLTIHKNPGMSERKFIEIFEEISKFDNRDGTISRDLFITSFRRYRQMRFKVDCQIKMRTPFRCPACGDSPLAIHIDGNRKLYAYECPEGWRHPPLLGHDAIASDAEFRSYKSKIDAVKPPRAGKPVRDSCGGAVYRAGKEDSSATKGLASTGMVFATCRHSILWKAVNMDRGESYRHTHLLHDFALACGFRIVCYDVVCQYWPFACDLASKLPEFKSHVEQMRPFLSRWHGKTHSWQCQQLFSGHLLEGAGLTTGETTEESNSKMSRYSNTKYMNEANRLDRMTEAMSEWNAEKIENLPKILVNRLDASTNNRQKYMSEFNRLVNQRKKKVTELESEVDRKLISVEQTLSDLTKKTKKLLANEKPLNPTQQEVKTAEILKNQMRANLALKSNLKKQKSQLALLLEKPITEQIPQILSHLQQEARNCQNIRISTKTPLEKAQRSLEGTSLVVKNLQRRTDREAVTSKERIELRSQMKTHKQKAAKLVKVINEQLGPEATQVTMADCKNGVFPWQPAYQVSYRSNVRLVDAWMLAQRCEEEIGLVKKEMTIFYQGMKDLRGRMLAEISTLSTDAAQACGGISSGPIAEELFTGGQVVLKATEVARIDGILMDAAMRFIDYVEVDNLGSFIREPANCQTEKDPASLHLEEDLRAEGASLDENEELSEPDECDSSINDETNSLATTMDEEDWENIQYESDESEDSDCDEDPIDLSEVLPVSNNELLFNLFDVNL